MPVRASVRAHGGASLVRVLQNGQVLARLSGIRQQGDKLTAIWHGAPPPSPPGAQIEPFVLESEDGLERKPPPTEGRGARGKTVDGADVLVIDDDPETVNAVASTLVDEGFRVRTAAGGREGLTKAAERAPAVVIVDLMMPEIGGQQVCAALRLDPKFSRTRILVLSGAEDTRAMAAEYDADSAIVKPFTPELLVHEVRRLVAP
jgi:CheY-like chemotaxis protein